MPIHTPADSSANMVPSTATASAISMVAHMSARDLDGERLLDLELFDVLEIRVLAAQHLDELVGERDGQPGQPDHHRDLRDPERHRHQSRALVADQPGI